MATSADRIHAGSAPFSGREINLGPAINLGVAPVHTHMGMAPPPSFGPSTAEPDIDMDMDFEMGPGMGETGLGSPMGSGMGSAMGSGMGSAMGSSATSGPVPGMGAPPMNVSMSLGEVTDQNYLTVLGRALDLVGWTDEQADSFSLKSFGIPHWDELGRSQAERLIDHLVASMQEAQDEPPLMD